MSRRIRYSQEVRERAVRMVIEHEGDYASQWEAIRSIAAKIGCSAVTVSSECRDPVLLVPDPTLVLQSDRRPDYPICHLG